MKYEKNQYSESFSVCTLIIAGAFLYWGISTFITEGFTHWWGYISTAIGIAILVGQILAIANRSKLRNVVLAEFQENPDASIEQVSMSTGISRKDIRAIILDLKANGGLRGDFSSETGQFKAAPIQETTSGKEKYCPNCGTNITEDKAKFCNYCGAEID